MPILNHLLNRENRAGTNQKILPEKRIQTKKTDKNRNKTGPTEAPTIPWEDSEQKVKIRPSPKPTDRKWKGMSKNSNDSRDRTENSSIPKSLNE